MIEAEYKARLHDPKVIHDRLSLYAESDVVTYQDTYFDDSQSTISSADRELRLRTITGAQSTKHLLTFKDSAVHAATGSKPEYETTVANRDSLEEIVRRLGYSPLISFTKECENFQFTAEGRDMLATIVTVPELDETFLELETQASDESDLDDALGSLRAVLAELGISPNDFTTELYTDAVARKRSGA